MTKTHYSSPKQYLYDEGLIPEIKQGRISGKNHDHLAAAVARGIVIDGYKPGKRETAKGIVSPVNAIVKSEGPDLPELFIRYDLLLYRAVQADGTVRSMKEACMNCGLSLVGHKCDSPRITSLDGSPDGVTVEVVRNG